MTGAANTARSRGLRSTAFRLYEWPISRNGLQPRCKVRPWIQGTTHFLQPINLYGNCLEKRKGDNKLPVFYFLKFKGGGASYIIPRTHAVLWRLNLLSGVSLEAWFLGCNTSWFSESISCDWKSCIRKKPTETGGKLVPSLPLPSVLKMEAQRSSETSGSDRHVFKSLHK
jgi:hypothetical protein